MALKAKSAKRTHKFFNRFGEVFVQVQVNLHAQRESEFVTGAGRLLPFLTHLFEKLLNLYLCFAEIWRKCEGKSLAPS